MAVCFWSWRLTRQHAEKRHTQVVRPTDALRCTQTSTHTHTHAAAPAQHIICWFPSLPNGAHQTASPDIISIMLTLVLAPLLPNPAICVICNVFVRVIEWVGFLLSFCSGADTACRRRETERKPIMCFTFFFLFLIRCPFHLFIVLR